MTIANTSLSKSIFYNFYIVLFIISSCASIPKTNSLSLYVQDKDSAPGSRLVLCAYNGENTIPLDTSIVEGDRIAYFSRNLSDGMYAICRDKEQVLVNFLISSNQPKKFGIRLSSDKSTEKIVFKGSPENESFQAYNILKERYRNLVKEGADEILFQNIDQEMKSLKTKIFSRFPSTTLSFYLQCKSIPSSLRQVTLNPDTKTGILEHYWDNIDFSDKRLLKLPIMEDKLFDYFFRLIPPDKYIEQIRYIDTLANKLQAYSDVYSFSFNYLYFLFGGSPFPHHDLVCLHLLKDHLVNSTHYSETYRIFYQFELKRLLMNTIGDTIPNLELTNKQGTKVDLRSSLKDCNLLYFYDPNCELCAVGVQELIKFDKLNEFNIEIVTISLDSTLNMTFPDTWVVTYADVNEVYSKFNFKGLPFLFLVKDNKIVYKSLSVEDIERYMNEKGLCTK